MLRKTTLIILLFIIFSFTVYSNITIMAEQIASSKPTAILDKNSSAGYITGYSDGTIRPQSNITRAETAVILYNLISNSDKSNYKQEAAKFKDVAASTWYSEAVGFLSASGIISGYQDKTFKPNNPITRAEFITIASKFSDLNLKAYIDFEDVETNFWAREYIMSAYNNGWTAGYPDGTFRPNSKIIRAEAIAIINKMLGRTINAEQNNSISLFTDLTEGKWYYKEMIAASDAKYVLLKPTAVLNKNSSNGYISGYSDGTIRPQNNITRAEAAVVLYNLISSSNKSKYKQEATKFKDVTANAWYSEAIGYLSAAGIISGYQDKTFKPSNPITRAEFATIASRFSELNLRAFIRFEDIPNSHWAKEYIMSTYNNGWVSGYPDGTFRPNSKISRAEAVTVINKMLGRTIESIKTNTTPPFTDLSDDKWYYEEIKVASAK